MKTPIPVSLLHCSDYKTENIKNAILASLDNLGGLDKYIIPGDKVLLKANLLMKKTPEEATTTHPAFVKAIAEILIDFGCEVLIGDSPGGPFNERMLNPIYKATGMEEIEKTTNAKLNRNFSSCEIENPKGVMLKKITAAAMLQDVDKVISLSKLKTHGMMTFTGAVKNQFGIIPGILKAEYHLNMPDKEDFANALIDICMCANPVLSFMDGITAMEGDGPSAGTPRNLYAVLASPSPYHLDKVACKLINLPLEKVPVLKMAKERSLIDGGLEDIYLLGDSIENFKVTDFKIPNTKEVNPIGEKKHPILSMAMSRYMKPKPIFNHSACIGCKICCDNCPAKVIVMKENRPVVDLKGCIRCFCCQELCPKKAVTIKRPLLLKILTGK